MIIKICGMQHAEDIEAAAQMGVHLLGFNFIPNNPRFVRMISSQAGIIPDYAEKHLRKTNKSSDASTSHAKTSRVGVFADDMPQNIVTRIYNYALDYVQLNGNEPAVTLENLRRTIDPDIHKGIKIIKRIAISSPADFDKAAEYEGKADLLLFDVADVSSLANEMQHQSANDEGNSPLNTLFSAYTGTTPFLISMPAEPFPASCISSINHPLFAGVNLDTQFEQEPGKKDMTAMASYLDGFNNIR